VRRFVVGFLAGISLLIWVGAQPFAVAQAQSAPTQSTPAENKPAGQTTGQSAKPKTSSNQSSAKSTNHAATASTKPGSATNSAAKKSGSTTSSSSKNATSIKRKAGTSTVARKRRPLSPRVRKVRQAFVASTSLRPMAQQLLQDRTPTAYTGVEAYARRHAREDAGALAWLVIGYAHTLDHDYAKAIEPLNRAKAGASELGDYVAFYLGDAYLKTGHNAEALATFAEFAERFPDSLLIRDARIDYANILFDEGRCAEAAALLEKVRLPVRSDVELSLGRSYEAAGNNEKAISAFRNIYFNLPTSFEAEAAAGELRKLGIQGSLGERRTRADLLNKAKRFSDAAHDYRELQNEVPPADKVDVQLALAGALEKSGGSAEGRQILTSMGAQTGDAEAERLYLLSETQRSTNDDAAVEATLNQLRQFGPSSPWLEQALFSAGNTYLLKKDYDHAIDYFRELQQRFPKGTRSSYSHWKAAWLSFRQGRIDVARQGFENQLALYPDSNEVPAALYWRGRIAEEDGNPAMARAFYQKLSDRFQNYYYAELGRQRLKALPASVSASANSGANAVPDSSPHFALLDRVPPLPAGKITAVDPPDDNLRVERARLLSNGGLADLAVRELQAAASQEGGTWAPPEMARVYQDGGRYDRGIEVMKRATPNYFAVGLDDLPRPYWEALFPKPYWTDLRKYSEANGLDPYLVASLIRQESEFNAGAISHANAVGLMQLLPRVGKTVAKQVKLKGFSAPQLYTPSVNLELGTRYFREMVDKYNGQFEYALAAYNAGSDRVEDWLGQGHYRDPQEFVESIPFTETREYVQAILRNANVYRQLYGTP
jgi:soluble lytic murein transglycosylase